MSDNPKKNVYANATKDLDPLTIPSNDSREHNPWTEDTNWRVDPRSFNVISGPSVAVRRKRVTAYPANFNKRHARTVLLPFNWLQIVNLFLGALAVLLFIKFLSVVFP